MSSKHTPGPWRLQLKDKFTDHPFVVRGEQGGFCVLGLSDEAEKADARLIAAAPDLLEALKNLVERIDKNGGIGEYKTDPVFVIKYARSAIAKAEGNKNE